ncbi:c-type cytochrome biogenesis protein CcsB [Desulforhopalus vacuolatus]|uniref:c-type cytochrome biogenesis protein CcsB n=1 Tax=Desulforhopalus vacuolatus TaxID=40414 RepID=UPI001962FC7A|nr:c-type cytochrome biogenesis protein CcsB [Desulforhopalus vacuolatus]MBM9519570.1 c-type cytochrome biogenesis protein CcsB [Desulforhopalus vacuolatus]
MDSSTLIGISTFTSLFATLLYGINLMYNKLGRVATTITAIALLIQTTGIGLRWIESYQIGIGHAPLTNMYESIVFFAWTIILLQLLVEWHFKTRISGTLNLALATIALAWASNSGTVQTAITPLVPALQSNWLVSHVITCFIGYAAFAMTAAFGLLYLLRSKGILVDRLPELNILDELNHKTMVFGFIWLTAGIISGSVWANSAWGTYWSWDSKEVWSLITWFFYAIILHARFTRGWSGMKIATLSMAGLAVVMFTYFGVNFWLSGLHSYGAS